MTLIDRERALSHPFANEQYDKKHADEHFIMGFEDYKEWLEDLPTVEAIPKDQYKVRLKADMVAMLEEIQLEIEELEKPHCHNASHADGCVSKWKVEGVIQQKINALKENKGNE